LNATRVPSADIAAPALRELPFAPPAALETRITSPVRRFLTKTSYSLSVSVGCRLVAVEKNATSVPSPDTDGPRLSPLPPAPAALADARCRSSASARAGLPGTASAAVTRSVRAARRTMSLLADRRARFERVTGSYAPPAGSDCPSEVV
jgi:hypothetical protein